MQDIRRRKGFTMLEMIVVIGIIIMVTAMMVPMIGSFLGGSGIQSGQRIVQGALLRARSMAVNLRRTIVVVFDHDPEPNFAPGNWGGGAGDNHVTATNTDALESYHTGKLIIYDLAQPNPALPGNTTVEKVPGETTLPKNVTFIYAPDFCAFNADGSMIMGVFQPRNAPLVETDTTLAAIVKCDVNGSAAVFDDASSAQFDKFVAEEIRAGRAPNSVGGTDMPYDVMIVRKGGAGTACYANLVRLTGRLGKWMIGERE